VFDLGKTRNLHYSLSGFRALGNITLEHVYLKGQRGSRGKGDKPEKESFALVQDRGEANLYMCEAGDADFSDPVDAYVSGWYTCAGFVHLCRAEYGPHGWFGFSCHGRTMFRGCYATAQWFWYTDTAGADAEFDYCMGDLSYGVFGSRASGTRHLWDQNGQYKAPRGVEWAYGADGGYFLSSNSKFKVEFLAAIDAKNGNIVFHKPTLPETYKNHIVGDSFKPVVLI
jgi:hypothetical protein